MHRHTHRSPKYGIEDKPAVALPLRLYRYRDTGENPTTFNDPFDCRFHILCRGERNEEVIESYAIQHVRKKHPKCSDEDAFDTLTKGNDMSLPLRVEPYFRAWILVDTWHTNNLSDLQRFYKFVWAVHRYCRPKKGAKNSKKRIPGDGEIREAIIEARRATFRAQYLEKKAQQFSSIYNHLLDFANTPNIPDHLIEKRDIILYRHQLEMELGGYSAKFEDIARNMKRDWGKDWQEKLDRAKKRLG